MSRGADELDAEMVLSAIRREIVEHQSLYPDLPTLELKRVWVNGSFGAGEATDQSDVDVTVEVGVFVTEYEMNPLYVADRITDLSGPLSTALASILPALPDVTVIPSPSVLDGADLDVADAEEHVVQTQHHGGYKTAFDMRSGEYVRIN
jgi:predicted nucleotidyltransferase